MTPASGYDAVMDRVASACQTRSYGTSHVYWNEHKPRASSARFSQNSAARLSKQTRALELREQKRIDDKLFEQNSEPNTFASALVARPLSQRAARSAERLAQPATRTVSKHIAAYLEAEDLEMWPDDGPFRSRLRSAHELNNTISRLYQTPIQHARPSALKPPQHVRLSGNYDNRKGWYDEETKLKSAVPPVRIYKNGTYAPDVKLAMEQARRRKEREEAAAAALKPKKEGTCCEVIDAAGGKVVVEELPLGMSRRADRDVTAVDIVVVVDVSSQAATHCIADTLPAVVGAVSDIISREGRAQVRIAVIGFGTLTVGTFSEAMLLLPFVLWQDDTSRKVIEKALEDARDAHRRQASSRREADAHPSRATMEASFAKAMVMVNRLGFDMDSHNSVIVVTERCPATGHGSWLLPTQETADQNVLVNLVCLDNEDDDVDDVVEQLNNFEANLVKVPSMNLVPAVIVAASLSTLDERVVANTVTEGTKILRPLLDPEFVGAGKRGVAAGIATHAHFSRWHTTSRQLESHSNEVLEALLTKMANSRLYVRKMVVCKESLDLSIRDRKAVLERSLTGSGLENEGPVYVRDSIKIPHIRLVPQRATMRTIARWVVLCHEESAIRLDLEAYRYLKKAWSATRNSHLDNVKVTTRPEATNTSINVARFGSRFASRVSASTPIVQRK